jgi:ferrous iron transport protein B
VVVGVLFVVGWAAGRVIPGEPSDFILELPPIRRPQFSNILIKTVARMEWYLKEVVPLFLIATFALFVLDRSGSLVMLEAWASPFIQGALGLPAATTGVFIVGFLRRDFGAAGLFSMMLAGALTTSQLLVSLVVITLFVPCIANVIVIIREHGWKTGVTVVLFVFPFAFAVGSALNFALRTLRVSFG